MRSVQLLVIFLAISTIQCMSDYLKKNILQWQRECLKETSVDRKLVMDAMINHQYPDDLPFKKFIYCLTKKSGIMDDLGNIHATVLKKYLINEGQSDSVAEEIVKKCLTVKGTAEDTALALFVCYQGKAPKEVQV
nr:odorant-binding protein 16 [Lytta caraganae]